MLNSIHTHKIPPKKTKTPRFDCLKDQKKGKQRSKGSGKIKQMYFHIKATKNPPQIHQNAKIFLSKSSPRNARNLATHVPSLKRFKAALAAADCFVLDHGATGPRFWEQPNGDYARILNPVDK